ncbi:hypothetical protein M0802_009023 [Mischocyttarus mexicanus]|nr:hypothetical protein M0802_009023 [Mischocyttarus mexicanus]
MASVKRVEGISEGSREPGGGEEEEEEGNGGRGRARARARGGRREALFSWGIPKNSSGPIPSHRARNFDERILHTTQYLDDDDDDDDDDDGKRILIKRGQVRFFTDQNLKRIETRMKAKFVQVLAALVAFECTTPPRIDMYLGESQGETSCFFGLDESLGNTHETTNLRLPNYINDYPLG